MSLTNEELAAMHRDGLTPDYLDHFRPRLEKLGYGWLAKQFDRCWAELAEAKRHDETIASVLIHTIGYGAADLGEGVRRLGILLERERRIVSAAKAVDHAWRQESGTGTRVVGPLRHLATAIDDLDISEVEQTADANRAVVEAAKAVVTVWRQWESSRGKEVIPIKALAATVDVLALAPASAALADGEGQALTHQQPQGEPSQESLWGKGCPAQVWDGPYKMRCGAGGDFGTCSTHGKFADKPEAVQP